jgi:hypothetical protein
MRVSFAVAACLGVISIAQAAPGKQPCTALSPAHTVALVELYTSEGCDSCPPADRWLSSLGESGLAPSRVVPVALHVDYWDYIGWKDPYAKKEFTLRQRLHASLKHARLVYTPQVLLQGNDFRAWRGEGFRDALAKVNAQPARASLSLSVQPKGGTGLEVAVQVEVPRAGDRAGAALYLAALRSGLRSRVLAGENRGRILSHDYVAFEWRGPFDVGPEGRLVERRSLPAPPGPPAGRTGVAAFVQNRGTGDVLQALMLEACPG